MQIETLDDPKSLLMPRSQQAPGMAASRICDASRNKAPRSLWAPRSDTDSERTRPEMRPDSGIRQDHVESFGNFGMCPARIAYCLHHDQRKITC